ncbi:kinase-like domain-containing protein [Rhizophagus clarus]|uniref:Kinase-like domain-containing protein n=1 Tax=Rhizophagus clarus TaxID=94130 RepID=A0A8H3LVZ2_9GLOM|nr:kinase-like domain-containing protein [Rhizophagus clarus]
MKESARKKIRNCLKDNFKNWTSGNSQIDAFIQSKQLQVRGLRNSTVFEWIPYNQFDDIKETKIQGITTAIWKDGPLKYNANSKKYKRKSNKKVVLKEYFYNTQNSNEFLNKIKLYLAKDIVIYGMSHNRITKDYVLVFHENYLGGYCCKKCDKRYTYKLHNKWCNPCQIDYLKSNFTNWTSGNKMIDDFIQKKQLLYINNSRKIVFEWVSYNQFIEIKRTNIKGFVTAIWTNGSLDFNERSDKYERNSNKKVVLKYFHNNQNVSDEFLNKVESCLTTSYNVWFTYGMSQDPKTKDYVLVFHENYLGGYCLDCGQEYTHKLYKWCKQCQINLLKSNFANLTSGNKQVDHFIQEKQLQIDSSRDTVFEWIPFNQFTGNIETKIQGFFTAMWEDGPLEFNVNSNKYERKSKKKVALKYLYNLQNVSDEFLNKAESYLITKNSYGMSQDPNSKDYILAFRENYLEGYCDICGEEYTYKLYKWCKLCQINHLENNFTSWTSENKQVDQFIQEKQLQIDSSRDTVFEWIPYNQFTSIKETRSFVTAIWKDGPLEYNINSRKYERNSNKKVVLEYFYNLQDVTDALLNKVLETTKDDNDTSLSRSDYNNSYGLLSNTYLSRDYYNNNYGISQNPDTKAYILVSREKYFKYCENCGIKYIDKIYRLCKPSCEYFQEKYCRECGENYTAYKWCKACQVDYLKSNFTNWTSGNEQIDHFIQEKQSQINSSWDGVFEWIPYDHFGCVKKIVNIGDIGAMATWENGPLTYDTNSHKYERNSTNKKVALKYLYNLQNISSFDKFLNKAISKDINYLYGISQDSDTKNYILIFHEKYFENYCNTCGEEYINKQYKWCKPCQLVYLESNFTNQTSGNKQIDCFIQEKQLQINSPRDIIFEWIPYNRFNNIKETGNDCATTVWEDGPLNYNFNEKKWMRKSNKKVIIKYLHNTQNIIDEIISKVKSKNIVYGISQDPKAENFILVLNKKYFEKYCEKCGEKNDSKRYKFCNACHINYLRNDFTNWTSGNEQIDSFIRKKQLRVDCLKGIVFKWIPYNQLSNIKERENRLSSTSQSKSSSLPVSRSSSVSSSSSISSYTAATWKDSLCSSNRNVALKYLDDSQHISEEFLNKVKSYLTEDISYGITQNPDTKNYILVFHEKIFENSFEYLNDYLEKCMEDHFEKYCIKCGKENTNEVYKWCKSCIINCKNIKIIDIIKNNSKIKWIPYNQFNDDFKKIGKGGFSTVYSTIWDNKKVALKCLHNTQKFLNEVEAYLVYTNQKFGNILKMYGISQNPDTEDFIIVLEYAEGGNFNDYLNRNYKTFDWLNNIQILMNIIKGLKEIHQEKLVHPTGRQPFSDRDHDRRLALDICKGVRPEINETKVPECYIELMKNCWDPNPNDRPNAVEIEDKLWLFHYSNKYNASEFKFFMRKEKREQDYEIEKQFKEAEEYRKENPISIKDIQLNTHSQANNYTSQLLNIFIDDLPASECLDCSVDRYHSRNTDQLNMM